MKHLEKLARKRLGEILLDEGLITKEQLAAAEQENARTGDRLGSILVESRNLLEDDLARAVASEYQLPFVELTSVHGNKEVRELFVEDDVRRYRFVPMDKFGSVVTLAVAEMPSLEFLHGVKSATGLTPFLFVAMLGDIDRANGVTGPSAELAAGPQPELSPTVAGAQEAQEVDESSWQIDSSSVDDTGWGNIFDMGNESVLKGMDPQEEEAAE